MNALTKDGIVHRPAPGPSGPTTACGRTEDVLTINEGWPVTCPDCAQPTPDEEDAAQDAYWAEEARRAPRPTLTDYLDAVHERWHG